MQYKVVTYQDKGIEKLVTCANPKDKRKLLYTVLDEQGTRFQADKEWLLQHINDIVNLSAYGSSLRVRNNTANSKVQTGVKLPQVVEDYILKQAEKKQSVDISIAVLLLMQSALLKAFTDMGLTDIEIEKIRDKCSYRLIAKHNAYVYPRGVLAFNYQLKDKFASSSADKPNTDIPLHLIVLNQFDEVRHTMNGGTYTNLEEITIFSDEHIVVGNLKECLTSQQLAEYKGVRYYAGSYNGCNPLYLDEERGRKLIKRVADAVIKFINKRKDFLSNKLYLRQNETPIAYQVVDRARSWHFPDASSSIDKAEKLEKRGYSIIVNGVAMKAKQFKEKCSKETQTSNLTAKFYASVSEFKDTKNKVFYVLLGSLNTVSLYC